MKNQPVGGVLSQTGQKTFGQPVQLTTAANKDTILEQRTNQEPSVQKTQDSDESTRLDLSHYIAQEQRSYQITLPCLRTKVQIVQRKRAQFPQHQ